MTDEAKWILENLPLPEKGIFCEVGAFDGVQGSNTLPFEDKGWTGLCVEADPLNAWKCAEQRRCKTLCAAIGSEEGLCTFQIDLSDRGLSGLDRTPEDCVSVIVPVVSLRNAIYSTIGRGKIIDLLSIDTEGTEVDAWNSIEHIRPQIVIMEYYTIGRPRNDRAVLNEMIDCGYKMVWENDVNMVFTYEK